MAVISNYFVTFVVVTITNINRGPMIKNDEMLFKRAEKAIISHKLYLRDDMSRSMLDTFVHIPKNKFAPVFRKFSGMGFPRYINELRLNHAVKLLTEQPELTIEGVAQECGIPVTQTFYRLFMAKYGMTPAAYRRKFAKK